MGTITGVMEDYLKMIYKLQPHRGAVSTSEIAARMHVSAASATSMVKRLARLRSRDGVECRPEPVLERPVEDHPDWDEQQHRQVADRRIAEQPAAKHGRASWRSGARRR